jgi:hypothetical protein
MKFCMAECFTDRTTGWILTKFTAAEHTKKVIKPDQTLSVKEAYNHYCTRPLNKSSSDVPRTILKNINTCIIQIIFRCSNLIWIAMRYDVHLIKHNKSKQTYTNDAT